MVWHKYYNLQRNFKLEKNNKLMYEVFMFLSWNVAPCIGCTWTETSMKLILLREDGGGNTYVFLVLQLDIYVRIIISDMQISLMQNVLSLGIINLRMYIGKSACNANNSS